MTGTIGDQKVYTKDEGMSIVTERDDTRVDFRGRCATHLSILMKFFDMYGRYCWGDGTPPWHIQLHHANVDLMPFRFCRPMLIFRIHSALVE